MKESIVTRIITNDTLPGDPRERTITYHAPSTAVIEKKTIELVGID